VSVQRQPSVIEAGASRTSFLCENGISLDRNTSTNLRFHGREMLILFQNDLLRLVEVTHVPLERKPSVLDETASCTSSPGSAKLVFEWNTSCNVRFSRWS
jgi:hypothetical protein